MHPHHQVPLPLGRYHLSITAEDIDALRDSSASDFWGQGIACNPSSSSVVGPDPI